MASRRKKRNQEPVDPLGGYTLDALMGLSPVSEVVKKKSIVGLPFRLVGAVLKLPFAIVGLPFKLLGKIFGTSKGKADTDA